MTRAARTAGLLAAWWLAALVSALAVATPAAAQQGQGGGRPPTPVEIGHVEAVEEAPRAEFTGLIEPATKAMLSAEVAGRLVHLAKKGGDPVAEGELMAVLDNPGLEDEYAVREARIRATEAQLRLSRTQLARNERLFTRKLISAQVVEDGRLSLAVTEAQLQADRVQLQRLEQQLARMEIRSPIAGQVIAANLELGQWITPNQPIFEIYNYDEFEVWVGVPGRLLASVPGSGPAQVRVPEIGASLQGRIAAAVRHVKRETGNFSLRIQVANRQGLPLSGMLAKVSLPVGEERRRLTVPRDAVVRRGDRTHVVVVGEDRTAQIVPVQVHGPLDGAVIVTGEGLRDGQTVVVRGNERLFPGMPVRVASGLSGAASG